MSSPSIVPPSDDQDVYLVLDDFGNRLGRAWRETSEADTELDVLLGDLAQGQYHNPVRVVAFNTAEGWSGDVSADIAGRLRRRFAKEGREAPELIEEFVDRHDYGHEDLQLPLPMRL